LKKEIRFIILRNLIFALQTLVERNKETNPTLLPYSKTISSAIVGFVVRILGRTHEIKKPPKFERLFFYIVSN